MKTILLMRHAKSDWSRPGQSDFDRDLNRRGKKDAPCMGRLLSAYSHMPDRVFSSPAKRARVTAELVAKHCGYAGDIHYRDDAYPGSVGSLLAMLQKLNDEIDQVLLIGHNPALEDTVQQLLAGEAIVDIALPTSALVGLEADIRRWSDLNAGSCRLLWFVIPRLIKKLITGSPKDS